MVKISEIFQKCIKKIEQKPFLTAVCINIIFLGLVLMFCEIKYETSDDYIMAAIIGGKYGEGFNPHMIYINILWGYLMLPFYYLIPSVSWYFLFQLCLCFCSFIVVTYLLFKKLNVAMAFMLTILFITFFSDDAYIMMQFTKTAILAIMSGSVLFLDSLFNENGKKIRKIILGGLLIFAGSLIRFDCIYIAGGFILLALAVEFGRRLKRTQGVHQNVGGIILAGAILIGIVVGAKAYDQFAYNADEQYSYFRAYGNARSNIVDKKDYGYEVCEKEYKDIGISENDYKLLRTWNFADPEFYTLELLEKAGEIISNYEKSQKTDRDMIKIDLRGRNYWSYPSLLACFILFTLSIIFIKKLWVLSGMSAVIGFSYLIYFAVRGRLLYRIEYAVFLCVFISSVYYWDKRVCRNLMNSIELYKICAIFTGLMCLYQVPTYRLNSWGNEVKGETYKQYIEDILFISWDYDSRRYRCAVYNDESFSELQKEILINPDRYYFMNFSTTIQTLYLPLNPLQNDKEGIWGNSSYFAGVDIQFPDNLARLQREGVSNPMKSLLENDVYLLDNMFQNEILTYIREHYNPNAEKTLYKTLDGFQIWKIYSD